jgi:hypothetical protein
VDRWWNEVEALALLADHGILVVPHANVTTVNRAGGIATDLGFPVAVKLVSRDIVHKSDVGGVILGLESPDEVERAFHDVRAAVESVPGAEFDGALISPMRSGGVELIVGIVRDELWGLALAVGLGGVLVHVIDDSALRVLPVGESDVREMLSELRGAALLDGVRGSKPIDRNALVTTILHLAQLAERLGDSLESIEINPLRAEGTTIEALDASIMWSR